MEFLLAIPLILLPLFFPVLTGGIAVSLGRKFWPWFLLGLVLPFIAAIILLCLPVKSIKPEILNHKN